VADKAVVDAVATYLAANWTTTPIKGVNLPGGLPKDGSAYVQVQYPVANSEQITIGAPGHNVFRETGAIRILVNAARTGGVDTGLGWAQTLATVLRNKILLSGALQTFAPGSPSIDDRNDDGNYFVLSFVVPYTFDILA
jgi:hypothetical protein